MSSKIKTPLFSLKSVLIKLKAYSILNLAAFLATFFSRFSFFHNLTTLKLVFDLYRPFCVCYGASYPCSEVAALKNDVWGVYEATATVHLRLTSDY